MPRYYRLEYGHPYSYVRTLPGQVVAMGLGSATSHCAHNHVDKYPQIDAISKARIGMASG